MCIKILRLLVFLKSNLDKITEMALSPIFSLLFMWKSLRNGLNRHFFNPNWNMRETPSKMHMHDMVTIDTTFFEIIKPPPPPSPDR